jgi:hypothetical protein
MGDADADDAAKEYTKDASWYRCSDIPTFSAMEQR